MEDWFLIPAEMDAVNMLRIQFVNNGPNSRYNPYEALSWACLSDSFSAKMIVSKRLHGFVKCNFDVYPTPQDLLDFDTNHGTPLKMPLYSILHIPTHILVYDVGRRLTVRYGSDDWGDVLPRIIGDYAVYDEMDRIFLEDCFLIYHAWMKAEPSKEWLNIPVPPHPTEPLGLNEIQGEFDDTVALHPFDSASNRELDCTSSTSREASLDSGREVDVVDDLYASRRSVKKWVGMVEPLAVEECTTPGSPGSSDDSSDMIG
ncbi:hypothetical protein ONZ45_g17960 [Pleurotus djamor]|nr:hypothetical protein ONZ45_g17960 [Pleurotus djamor]